MVWFIVSSYVCGMPSPLRYRAGAMCGLCEMERICLRGKRKLSASEQKQMIESYMVYRSGSMKLAAHALELRQPRWRQRPKCHALEHGIFDFHELNLRYLSNYLDEDFVRRTKKLALTSTPKLVSRHVLMRYSVAATLRWTGMSPS